MNRKKFAPALDLVYTVLVYSGRVREAGISAAGWNRKRQTTAGLAGGEQLGEDGREDARAVASDRPTQWPERAPAPWSQPLPASARSPGLGDPMRGRGSASRGPIAVGSS